MIRAIELQQNTAAILLRSKESGAITGKLPPLLQIMGLLMRLSDFMLRAPRNER